MGMKSWLSLSHASHFSLLFSLVPEVARAQESHCSLFFTRLVHEFLIVPWLPPLTSQTNVKQKNTLRGNMCVFQKPAKPHASLLLFGKMRAFPLQGKTHAINFCSTNSGFSLASKQQVGKRMFNKSLCGFKLFSWLVSGQTAGGCTFLLAG